MNETDPSYPLPGLDELRAARLRPQTIRKVLWYASYRIMEDKAFEETDRMQAGVYLETIFRAIDAIDEQDAEFAPQEKCPVTSRLDMGFMMDWAYSEAQASTLPPDFDPNNREHRNIHVHMKLSMGLTEAHLGVAYGKYLEYQDRARNAGQLGLKWF